MPRSPALSDLGPHYKQLNLSLLQVFRQVAQSGSQAAAARRLGIAQPTVWDQMRSLERLLGTRLLEVQGRSSRLTDDGRRLLNLVLPILEAFESLPERLAEERGVTRRHLRVATTPRGIQEDLPQCLVEFERLHPDVHLTIIEHDDPEIPGKVLDHEIDIGFAPIDPSLDAMQYLEVQLAYETDIFLIALPDHPLAKRRTVLPEDLIEYSLVNGLGTLYGPRMRNVEARMVSTSFPRQVSAFYTSTIRKLVMLGFGIGIVNRRANYPSDPELHERNLSKHAGRNGIFAIMPRGANNQLANEFLGVVRAMLR